MLGWQHGITCSRPCNVFRPREKKMKMIHQYHQKPYATDTMAPLARATYRNAGTGGAVFTL